MTTTSDRWIIGVFVSAKCLFVLLVLVECFGELGGKEDEMWRSKVINE